MLLVNFSSLTISTFIKLNELKEVRKIKLKDIYTLNTKITEFCEENSIEYISNMDSIYVYDLRFNYHMYFQVLEEEYGYTVSLKKEVNTDDLIKIFNFKNKQLDDVLNNIDIQEIFFKEKDFTKNLQK